MSRSNIEQNNLLEERASLLQVRRYIDSYTDIFKDFERNIRTFILDATDVILPRLEKTGYYELDQYTVTNYDELKEALFEYSQERDITDLKKQIGQINSLISERTLRKIHGADVHIDPEDIENIYDLRETVQMRLNQIDEELQNAANEPQLHQQRGEEAA